MRLQSSPTGWARPAWIGLVLLLSLVCLAACGEPLATPETQYLQAAGSMSMSPVVAELAIAFGERSSLVHFKVSGPGTQYGLDALAAGKVDLAMASWLPNELEEGWQATAVARDGIAVIVHPENSIDGLGMIQLQSLFSGRLYEWRALGASQGQGEIQLVSREMGSGDRAAFEALVMDAEEVAPMALVMASDEAVVEYVAKHPGAIGYVSQSRIGPQVKVLEVEGMLPTAEQVARGSYPIARDWWLVSAGEQDAVQDFVEFCAGPAGQVIISQAQEWILP